MGKVYIAAALLLTLSACDPPTAWLCRANSGEEFKVDGRWNPEITDRPDRKGHLRLAADTRGCIPLRKDKP